MERKTPEVAPTSGAIEPARRRRRYSAEEKLRLLTEAEAPGSSTRAARNLGVALNTLERRMVELGVAGDSR